MKSRNVSNASSRFRIAQIHRGAAARVPVPTAVQTQAARAVLPTVRTEPQVMVVVEMQAAARERHPMAVVETLEREICPIVMVAAEVQDLRLILAAEVH